MGRVVSRSSLVLTSAWLTSAWLSVVMLLAACAPGAATPRTADDAKAEAASVEEEDPDALPDWLAKLGITAEQRVKLDALLEKVERDLEPARAKNQVFRDTMVSAAARCSADDSRLHIEAKRMVDVGESARPHVLDAINTFHHILTAEQRKKLVAPLLTGEEELGEDTTAGREEGLGEIANALDLDFLQKLELVKRALSLLSVTTSETGALRDQALVAVRGFPEDDFDIRSFEIAEAPVMKLYTRLVLDLSKAILPVLSDEQCKKGASLLRGIFKRNDEKREKRKKARDAKRREKARAAGGSNAGTTNAETDPPDTSAAK